MIGERRRSDVETVHPSAIQSRCSMKVMRGHDGAGDVERNDALGFDVNHAVLILQRAIDAQKAAAGGDHAVAFEHVRSEDDVGDAGFIFEGEKYESLGGTRTLARNDASGDADRLIARALEQVHCR